ncbi:MAG: hypothetical protein Q8P24_02280 [Desulfobacterales bacterium]|nr:hypothetical protein [Desulfobacterales bacterium]
MKILSNPTHRAGDKNIYCPYYTDCLDYAVKLAWRFWDCSECMHKSILQSVIELDFRTDDSNPYYPLPAKIYRKIQ